jgi:hypothetical protein
MYMRADVCTPAHAQPSNQIWLLQSCHPYITPRHTHRAAGGSQLQTDFDHINGLNDRGCHHAGQATIDEWLGSLPHWVVSHDRCYCCLDDRWRRDGCSNKRLLMRKVLCQALARSFFQSCAGGITLVCPQQSCSGSFQYELIFMCVKSTMFRITCACGMADMASPQSMHRQFY